MVVAEFVSVAGIHPSVTESSGSLWSMRWNAYMHSLGLGCTLFRRSWGLSPLLLFRDQITDIPAGLVAYPTDKGQRCLMLENRAKVMPTQLLHLQQASMQMRDETEERK